MKKNNLLVYSKVLRPSKILFISQLKSVIISLTLAEFLFYVTTNGELLFNVVMPSILVYFLLEIISVAKSSIGICASQRKQKKNIFYSTIPNRENIMRKAFIADDLMRLISIFLHYIVFIINIYFYMRNTNDMSNFVKFSILLFGCMAITYLFIELTVFLIRKVTNLSLAFVIFYCCLPLFLFIFYLYRYIYTYITSFFICLIITIILLLITIYFTRLFEKSTYKHSMCYIGKEKNYD